MPVEAYWVDDEQTLIQYDFEGVWTWEEFYPVYGQVVEMMKTVPHKVDNILDLRASRGVPPNALSHLKNLTDKQLPNTGVCIFVTDNSVLTLLYRTGAKFHPAINQTFALVKSLEEARDIVAESRSQRDAS